MSYLEWEGKINFRLNKSYEILNKMIMEINLENNHNKRTEQKWPHALNSFQR